MSVTSAPIGNTGQSLDGFAVNANVPAAFRESVVITDPNDPSGVAPVVSTQPLTGYALPVWIQGTPNFSSTVNVTTNVNVTSNLSGTISSYVVSSVPLLVDQNNTNVPFIVSMPGTTNVFGTGTSSVYIVSSRTLTVSVLNTITVQGQTSSFPIGTTQVNIVSSIPLGGGVQYLNNTVTTAPTGNVNMWAGGTSSQTMVAISTSQPLPVYQISTGPVGPLVGTTMVNVVSTVIQNVNLTSSIPILVAQSTTPWVISSAPIALTGTSFVNVVSTVTQNVNLTSSIPVIVAQSTTPWVVSASALPAITGTVSTFPTGQASVTAMPSTGGGLIPFIKIGVTTASVQIKSGAGKLYEIAFTNTATSTRWLKFYNASSAAVGTTAPFMTFGMPGNTTGAQAIAGWIASPNGYGFSSNIFVAATATSATSTDTSAPGSADIVLNVGYI